MTAPLENTSIFEYKTVSEDTITLTVQQQLLHRPKVGVLCGKWLPIACHLWQCYQPQRQRQVRHQRRFLHTLAIPSRTPGLVLQSITTSPIPTQKSLVARLGNEWWLWEILSGLLSILCLPGNLCSSHSLQRSTDTLCTLGYYSQRSHRAVDDTDESRSPDTAF